MSEKSASTAKTASEPAGRSARYDAPPPAALGLASSLLDLQHAAGNRSVGRLLGGALLQPKLRIGPPGDAYEQEADRVADAVLRGEAAGPAAISQAQASGAQRKCHCQEEEDLVQPKTEGATPRSIPGFETRVDTLRGSGQPLPADVRSFFEPRFGHDFGAVRIHTGAGASEATQAVRARAFTVGNDVVFGGGEWSPETNAGKSLLAHELTHVVQQTPLARRKTLLQRAPEEAGEAAPQTESAPPMEGPAPSAEPSAQGEPTNEAAAADQTPAAAVVVADDAAEVGEGQMTKGEFMGRLRTEVCAAAEAGLAGTEHSAQGCPLIEFWFGYYGDQSAERINESLPRFAGEGARPTTAEGYISLIAGRVRTSVATWARTGEITGVPRGIPLPGMSLPGLGSIGGLLGGLGGVFFKALPGGPRDPGNPVALQARLGAGRPLDGAIRSRMESAFGRSFSHVQVHTDSAAAGLSAGFNARAFTVGHHVAFGPQEYRPGTMIGDALIAHELAHVAQQGDAAATGPVHTGGAAYQALERDADLATVGAVASLWTGLRGRMRSLPRPQARLSSGLRLQRCGHCGGGSPQQTTATPQPPAATPQPPAPAPAQPAQPAQPAASPPRLTFAPADHGERQGTCGSYSWQTQWSLDRPTSRGGYIVQMIDLTLHNATDCNGVAPDPDPPIYWEAWRIDANESVTTKTKAGHLHDDELINAVPVPNTKGNIETHATADFYEGLTLPPAFVVDLTSPAHELPMTRSDPHLTGGSGVVDRTLLAEWNCCPGSTTRATTLTHR